MQDASEQQLKPKSPMGYQPLLPAEFTQNLGQSAYSYVAIAAGLGLLMGVGVAITASHLKAPVGQRYRLRPSRPRLVW